MQAPEPIAESIVTGRQYARTSDVHRLNGARIMEQRQLTMVAATAVALSLVANGGRAAKAARPCRRFDARKRLVAGVESLHKKSLSYRSLALH
jgi:hypothetical protein